MSFGASTRVYTIREKPQSQPGTGVGESKTGDDEELKGLLGLPEEETELEVHTSLFLLNLNSFSIYDSHQNTSMGILL